MCIVPLWLEVRTHFQLLLFQICKWLHCIVARSIDTFLVVIDGVNGFLGRMVTSSIVSVYGCLRV